MQTTTLSSTGRSSSRRACAPRTNGGPAPGSRFTTPPKACCFGRWRSGARCRWLRGWQPCGGVWRTAGQPSRSKE